MSSEKSKTGNGLVGRDSNVARTDILIDQIWEVLREEQRSAPVCRNQFAPGAYQMPIPDLTVLASTTRQPEARKVLKLGNSLVEFSGTG